MPRIKKALRIVLPVIVDEFFMNDDTEEIIAARKEDDASVAVLLVKDKLYPRKHFRLGHINIAKDEDWIDKYLETDFHQHFRMRKDTFSELIQVVHPLYPKKMHCGNNPIVRVDKAVAMCIYYLGHTMPMDVVGEQFGVVQSTVYKEVNCVVNILCHLSNKFIVWPTQDECVALQQQFYDIAGFPGVIGAIDGCSFEVLAPIDDQDSNTDRKMNHSIILQGICTASKMFTSVSIGTSGPRNDCGAFSSSSLYKTVTSEGHQSIFYEESYHIIGDNAYPNRSWLLAPYKNYGSLTDKQKKYNYIHSVTRVAIEHTFGLLQGRWRRLQGLPLKDVSKDSTYIIASCVLHNFCHLHNDDVISDMVQNVKLIGGDRGFRDIYLDKESKLLGDQKRDRIKNIL